VEGYIEIDDGCGYEEVYVVLCGCVMFMFDGEEFDVLVGIFVFVELVVYWCVVVVEFDIVVLVFGGVLDFVLGAGEWIDCVCLYVCLDF